MWTEGSRKTAEPSKSNAFTRDNNLEKSRVSHYLSDSLSSLVQSTSLIKSLPFARTQCFTRAVLSSEEWFETHLIRDAEPYELALFRPAESRYDVPPESSLDRTAGEERWTATQRLGPQRAGGWDKASPLKEKKGAGDDPERCLKAAKRLLEIYSMPRANEHVEALHDQYEGLVDAIAELDEALKRPLSRANAHPYHEDHFRASELEEAIKREQMEIFALEQIHAEKQAEIASLTAKPRQRKPPPTKPAAPSPSELNPFAKSSLLDQRAAVGRAPSPFVASPPRAAPPRQTTPQATRTTHVSPSPPAKEATKATTPKRPSRETSGEATPKAPPPAAVKAGGTGAPKDKLPIGVTGDDLEAIAAKVWNSVGDALRPWARKTILNEGKEVPSPLISLSFRQTLSTLRTILTSPQPPLEPASPHSIASSYGTLASEADDADPSPPTSSALLEFELLNLLFSTLSATAPIASSASSSPTTLPPLGVTLRDPVLASSFASATVHAPGKKDPMVSMNALKAWLGQFAKERGWGEDMGTTAIYALVSKTVLRIDRRGKEGPMLGFRN